MTKFAASRSKRKTDKQPAAIKYNDKVVEAASEKEICASDLLAEIKLSEVCKYYEAYAQGKVKSDVVRPIEPSSLPTDMSSFDQFPLTPFKRHDRAFQGGKVPLSKDLDFRPFDAEFAELVR